jgi:hypothetical protein
MRMVRIRHMRMGVASRLVPMDVTVGAFGHRIVPVVMVTVIVPVRVFVLQRLVLVLVAV